MLITAAGLNPAASFCDPGPAISPPMACLAAAEQSEMGTNVLCWVCVREKRDGEKESVRKRRRREKRGRGKQTGARGRNVVAACQLLIRALVCPLWVGGRD